jgi:hypothetical protein
VILDCNTAAANIKQLQLSDHIGESFPILLNKNLKTYLPSKIAWISPWKWRSEMGRTPDL